MTSFSVTEIQGFQRCRRRWDIQSMNRQGLQKKGMQALALLHGSAVHEALAAQGAGLDPMTALHDYFEKEMARISQDYFDQMGTGMSALEWEPFEQTRADATALVIRYFDHHGWDNPLGDNYRYIVTEISFSIPVPGTRHKLAGTFDGIAEEIGTGRYWLVEHKTYSQQPNEDKMSTDWQISCYCWAAEQLHGIPIAGVLYDGMAKKLPKPPAVLSGKKGGLSKSMTTMNACDYATYFATIQRYGLPVKDYEDVLQQLTMRDRSNQTPFFTRWKVEISRAVIENTEKTLTILVREMASSKLQIVPNFRWEGCFDCGVRDLCKAMQFGEDVPWLIENGYVRGKGHTTTQRENLPRYEIQSFDELKNSTRTRTTDRGVMTP